MVYFRDKMCMLWKLLTCGNGRVKIGAKLSASEMRVTFDKMGREYEEGGRIEELEMGTNNDDLIYYILLERKKPIQEKTDIQNNINVDK